jgi:hypothetical protein
LKFNPRLAPHLTDIALAQDCGYAATDDSDIPKATCVGQSLESFKGRRAKLLSVPPIHAAKVKDDVSIGGTNTKLG